ncbi:MAG: fasciclin domain-containing protein, partial [Candidatus Thermoplasmatota archaeon]|nr:fasciclin domain-containing protein [Candidatus Thermoplasmatota archaeon]
MANGENATFTVDSESGAIMIQDATVTTGNVFASNGIVHIVDKLVLPSIPDIPATAQSTGVHNSLVAALTQANLVTTLQGDGPFTVFAPTDQAFIDAGIDLSTFDTDDEIATLVDILTYHVVPGQIMSTELVDGGTAQTVNTDAIAFTVSADGVMVNDANVTLADVVAS